MNVRLTKVRHINPALVKSETLERLFYASHEGLPNTFQVKLETPMVRLERTGLRQQKVESRLMP